MFQVGDRVKLVERVGDDYTKINPLGTVVSVSGRWIHVRHDPIKNARYVQAVPPRFDYLEDDLEHANALLKLVRELG